MHAPKILFFPKNTSFHYTMHIDTHIFMIYLISIAFNILTGFGKKLLENEKKGRLFEWKIDEQQFNFTIELEVCVIYFIIFNYQCDAYIMNKDHVTESRENIWLVLLFSSFFFLLLFSCLIFLFHIRCLVLSLLCLVISGG